MNACRKRDLILRRLVLAVLQRHHGDRIVSTRVVADWVSKLGVHVLLTMMPWSSSMITLEYLREAGLVKQRPWGIDSTDPDAEIVKPAWQLTYDGWVISLGLEPEAVIEEAVNVRNAERSERAGNDASEGSMREAGTAP